MEDMKDTTTMEITKDTRLIDILNEYPWIKDVLIEKNPKAKMLFSPIGKALLMKGTIEDLAKKVGKSPEELIDRLNQWIRS